MTTTTTTLAITALLVTSLAACTPNQGSDTTGTAADTASSPAATEPMPAEPATPTPAVTDANGEALALLVAVNEHEIAAAEQARGKQVDGPVLEYVDMLHSEHSRNLADTRSLGDSAAVAIVATPAIDAMKAKGESEMQRLAALDGDAYEAAYLTAMVNGHAEALATIDDRLMAAVTNEPVKQHLTTTRAAIARHLDAAKQLQGSNQ